MKTNMKLFVWCNPYNVAQGSSMLCAVASTETKARKLAVEGQIYNYGQYPYTNGNLEDIVTKLGKPDRVVDLPCAEWYEWSE